MAHAPVLVDAVVELFEPALGHGGVLVDCTIGAGGHARAILEAFPRARLVGIDRDPHALASVRTNLADLGERVELVRDDFKNLASVVERLRDEEVRGVLLDLGVSSPQLDEPYRGFSFRHEGPLDMRMDPDSYPSADTVVNTYTERDLGALIARYGEERFARRIARAIVAARPVSTTTQLAEIVKNAIPAATRRTGGHPARRTFQALRIEVNRELDALESALPAAVDGLASGGRVAVLSYHSLEDRIVKRFFLDQAQGCVCPPDLPICRCGAEARVRVVTRRPVTPSETEMERNPRAGAAKLRVAERLGMEEAA
jgi:16S rRNA (cytosine1402-N4)-methyltransferase